MSQSIQRQAEVSLRVDTQDSDSKLDVLKAKAAALRKEFSEAFKKGDTKEIDRINREINKVNRATSRIQNDTRFIFVKGDTVIDWRDRWRERTKEVHDTVYVERTDSVPVPCPVERELSRWERVKVDYGGFALGLVGSVLAVAVIWLAKKFRR
ncbi:MAG: hypothetical protein K2G49_10180 [Muribaculum sp.]|nr:hypothetical protein [Muribaculum sp.]